MKRALAVFFDMEVRVLPRVALPKSAYYRPRRRYRAEKLLKFLDKRAPKDAYRVLGITAVDISTTKKPYKTGAFWGLPTWTALAASCLPFAPSAEARTQRTRVSASAKSPCTRSVTPLACPTAPIEVA